MRQAIFCILLFNASSSFTQGIARPVRGDFKWHKIKTNSSLKPSPRFGASTWVDNSGWLWLFGGKNVSDTQGRGTAKQLNDLWKFSPRTLRWYYIPSQNMSRVPYTDGLTCFCHGSAFLLASPSQNAKVFHELWMYKISLNVWFLKDLPRDVKNSSVCFALWCNHSLSELGLLCKSSNHNHKNSYQMWTYAIKTGNWNLLSIANSISKSNKYSIWTGKDGTVKMYHWPSGNSNNSVLLSITHTNVTFTLIDQNPGCRTGFVNWMDSTGNLYLLGGKKCNSSQFYLDKWMLNISNYKWVSVNLQGPNPALGSDACSWKLRNSIWVYGGYVTDQEGDLLLLQDMWLGNTSEYLGVTPEHHLPGDTLELSMVNKLIISAGVLFVVMAIMIRLCYKRELNQMLSQLKRHRVPYHQLNQSEESKSRI